MQFFNLSLISVLALSANAAPTGTSTIMSTATPTGVTTTSETVLVKQGNLLNKAVSGFQNLNTAQKVGASGVAAVAAGTVLGGISYAGYQGAQKLLKLTKTSATETSPSPETDSIFNYLDEQLTIEDEEQDEKIRDLTSDSPHFEITKQQWEQKKQKLNLKSFDTQPVGGYEHQSSDGVWGASTSSVQNSSGTWN
jgi:hypothetical protein